MQISTLPKLISMFIVDALIGNWNRHNGANLNPFLKLLFCECVR